jgi:2-polyprenyl-6-methoxyphenol hydroxylase-like FAD-dependent oxidoreductase
MNVHVEQTPLEDIVSDDGRVVLVGDAAHAMVVSGLLKIKPGELY